MKRVLVSENAKENVELQDLSPVLREVTEDKQEWVYRYCERERIGQIVYGDFVHYNKSVMKNDDTYMFSAELPQEGILSMTQAFQVLITTLEGFGMDKDPELGEEIKQKTLRLFDRIMEEVIQEDGCYQFTTTPYVPESDHFTKENARTYAYIDTLTWVMSAVLGIFRLHMNGSCQVGEERIEKAKKVYKYCIEYLIGSFIAGDENAKKFTCGWNYTANCNAPNLYFTFAVSELMIDILDTFNNVIRSADIDLIKEEIDQCLGVKISENPEREDEIWTEIDAKKAQAELRYQEERKNLLSGKTCYALEEELFRAVNKGYPVYDEKSPYAQLENYAKQAVRNIWNLTKDQLVSTFFSGNLASTVPESVIEQSIQSDAVFNTIFIINAVINAGLDEDAEDKITYYTLNGSQEYEEALAEYDAIRDTLRIGYDNAYQFYLKMEKKKKAYKINEYTLSFDENFKTLEERVNELRKARIRVFSLMPLLVKTKTTLGEFVIQYPQYDMQIYLENILSYRCVRKKYGLQDDYYWTWEKDGYSSSSNYYFLSALNDFYNYYDKYELYASKNATANDRARTEIRDAYLEELKKSDGEIGQLEQAKQECEEQIRQLQTQLEAQNEAYAQLREQFDNDPLRKALNEFVCKVVTEHLLNMASVGNLLSHFSESLTAAAQERVASKAEGAADRQRSTAITEQQWYRGVAEEQDSQVRALEDGLHKLGMALLSERLLEMLYADKPNRNITQTDYDQAAESVHQDLADVLRYYLAPMASGQKSDYVATKGYTGLPQIIREREKSNQKK